jgi:hypothetical protein
MTQLNGVGLNYSFNNKNGMIEPLTHPGLGVAFRMPFDK